MNCMARTLRFTTRAVMTLVAHPREGRHCVLEGRRAVRARRDARASRGEQPLELGFVGTLRRDRSAAGQCGRKLLAGVEHQFAEDARQVTLDGACGDEQ
jgi:hypothetical protein